MGKGFGAFMENPYWQSVYMNAPSEECRAYLEYTFYSSLYYDPDSSDAEQFAELQAHVEKPLHIVDWEYLKCLSPSSPFVGYCNRKIRELSIEGQAAASAVE